MSASDTPRVPLWNIANILTMTRMVMVPIFVVVAALYHEDIAMRWVIAGIFVLAMVTDFVDGYLARSRNLITDFGKIMDPIADKAMTGAALIMLSVWQYVPWWTAVLPLGREIGITVMRFTILKYGALPANFSGKAKTMMQSIGITFCLMPFELMWPPAWWIGITLIAIALVLTLWSGLRNVNDGLRLRREALAQKAAEREWTRRVSSGRRPAPSLPRAKRVVSASRRLSRSRAGCSSRASWMFRALAESSRGVRARTVSKRRRLFWG